MNRASLNRFRSPPSCEMYPMTLSSSSTATDIPPRLRVMLSYDQPLTPHSASSYSDTVSTFFCCMGRTEIPPMLRHPVSFSRRLFASVLTVNRLKSGNVGAARLRFSAVATVSSSFTTRPKKKFICRWQVSGSAKFQNTVPNNFIEYGMIGGYGSVHRTGSFLNAK